MNFKVILSLLPLIVVGVALPTPANEISKRTDLLIPDIVGDFLSVLLNRHQRIRKNRISRRSSAVQDLLTQDIRIRKNRISRCLSAGQDPSTQDTRIRKNGISRCSTTVQIKAFKSSKPEPDSLIQDCKSTRTRSPGP